MHDEFQTHFSWIAGLLDRPVSGVFFIRLLWAPLKDQGFEFALARKDGTASLRVTRCPLLALGDRTGLRGWLYHLACSTDPHSAQGFSPRIVFARTKTLMQGDDCCDHCYRYAGTSALTA